MNDKKDTFQTIDPIYEHDQNNNFTPSDSSNQTSQTNQTNQINQIDGQSFYSQAPTYNQPVGLTESSTPDTNQAAKTSPNPMSSSASHNSSQPFADASANYYQPTDNTAYTNRNNHAGMNPNDAQPTRGYQQYQQQPGYYNSYGSYQSPTNPPKTYIPPNQSAAYATPPPSSTSHRGRVPSQPAKKKGNFFRYVAALLVVVLISSITLGVGYSIGKKTADTALTKLGADQTQLNINQVTPTITTSTKTSDSVISSIAEVTGPSVVTITTTINRKASSYFFNENYSDNATGSGIVYKMREKDILIITNHHVINGASAIEVTFHDGNTFAADVIGYDSQRDVALISIPIAKLSDSDIKSITVPKFGDSTKLKVGQLAVAIGNPLGKEFAATVTAGVISAVNRELLIEGTNLSLIQTDAAINPGNSGGALVNANNEIIGINTAKFIDERVEGMGFAIPMHIALPIIEKIEESGHGRDIATLPDPDKAFLGVSVADISDSIYEETGMPFGAYVKEVIDGSPAKAAGVQAGDIIFSINGNKIVNVEALFAALGNQNPDDVIKVRIVRNDNVLTLSVTLKAYKDIIQN